MKKTTFIAAVFIIFSAGAIFSEENSSSGAVFAPSFKEYLDLSSSANPDLPCFQIHFAGLKANAVFGSELGAFGLFSGEFKYMLALATFINLYDYSQSFIPYMLWRGSFGFNNYLEFPGLVQLKDCRLIFKIGIIHESDHYTGSEGHGYWEDYNINFSHMNYLDLGLISESNFAGKDAVLLLNIGYKYNFNNLLNLSGGALAVRNPVHSFYVAGSYSFKIGQNIDLYLSAYIEKISNDPPVSSSYSSRPEIYSATGSDYIYFNLGLKIKGSSGIACQPYLIYSYSNGRGVDFLFRENIFGLGLRIVV